MNKFVLLVLLIGGVGFMIGGIDAANSFNSDVPRFFTGSPPDKAVWMFIGGSVATTAGLTVGWRSRNRA